MPFLQLYHAYIPVHITISSWKTDTETVKLACVRSSQALRKMYGVRETKETSSIVCRKSFNGSLPGFHRGGLSLKSVRNGRDFNEINVQISESRFLAANKIQKETKKPKKKIKK